MGRQNPPTYKPSGAYFTWTVKVHNAVNAKLGKPQNEYRRCNSNMGLKIETAYSEPISADNKEPT